MSIIQEALKKAQTLYAKESVNIDPPQRPETPVDPMISKQKPHHVSIPFTKLAPGIVLLVIFAGFGLSSLLSKDTSNSSVDKQYHSVSYKPAAVVNDAASKDPVETGLGIRAEAMTSPLNNAIQPGAAFVNAPDLELNGIMYIEEKPRAIINGNTVEVGDFVSGARIDSITSDSVLLNYDNMEITLKLKE